MCSVCKNEFEFNGIRYASDGHTIICKNCYEQTQKVKKKKPQDTKIQRDPNQSIKVICSDCRYKFSLKKKSEAKPRCPYCGRNRLVRDDTTAERLVEEASRIKEDFVVNR